MTTPHFDFYFFETRGVDHLEYIILVKYYILGIIDLIAKVDDRKFYIGSYLL